MAVRILICNPEGSGHYLRYVQSIAAEAIRRGHQPIVTMTKAAREQPAWAELRAALPESVLPEIPMRDPLIPFLPRFSLAQMLLRQWLSWLSFRACYSLVRPDFVLAAYFDDLEIATALHGSPFGKTPWAGLVLRTRFHNPVPLRHLRRWLFERNQAIPTLKAVLTVDETLAEYYRTRPERAPKVRFVPEQAELAFRTSKAEARRRLGIPVEGNYGLLYGYIVARKGLGSFLRAASAVRETKVLLVGPQDPEARELIAAEAAVLREERRLFEFDAFASTTTEALAFSACDYVWTGYSKHDLVSSVHGKACWAGRPVVACNIGNIGWTTQRYKVGLTVDVNAPAQVETALRTILTSAPGYEVACLQYAARHTVAAFAGPILDYARSSVEKK